MMTILYIFLGIILIGIAIFLLKVVAHIFAAAIGVSLMTGMVCGVFYLLGWMEADTVWTCMKWGFFIGIPCGIWWVISNPQEIFNDGKSSSSSSNSTTRYTGYDADGHYIELEQNSRYSEISYRDPTTGELYERDSSGNFHKR